MDIISQLQEQVNSIAAMAFNNFGTLQRDAPPVRLSPNYPPPPPSSQTLAPNTNNTTTNNNHNNGDSINNNNNNNGTAAAVVAEDPADVAEQTKLMASSLVKAAKQFDALVAALPLSEGGEEAQLKRIAELQAENDVIGQELQRQLEAAEKELKQVQELFSQATDNCLNLKKPD